MPFHWTSTVPKIYKRNIIIGELYRSKRISSDFNEEVKRIRLKFIKAGYPFKFIESVIRNFQYDDDEIIIPQWLFQEKKEVYVRIPFCQKNEKYVYRFIKKLESFSEDSIMIKIIWSTKKIKELFPLKDRNLHKSNVIYEGLCTCGSKYIGETTRNAELRWSEHTPKDGKSEPAKHQIQYNDHHIEWKIITRAPKNNKKRKILEAFYINKFKPNLNNQIETKSLNLFRNGIT